MEQSTSDTVDCEGGLEQDNQASTTSDTSMETCESRLLALPGELRETVYDYCLQSDRPVHITSDLKQPPLLWSVLPGQIQRPDTPKHSGPTCRQIRREALDIWYGKNKFRFRIHDCEDKLMVEWNQHLKDVDQRNCTVVTGLYGRRDWDNLVKWCKNLWSGKSIYLKKEGEHDNGAEGDIVAAAHDIALGVASWSECERALENLRSAVRALGQDWDGEVM